MTTTTKQLNKKQATAFYNSDIWKDWNHEQVCRFQLFQRLLCVPFSRFHKAVEAVLDRPVYTHEFGLNYDGIVLEYLGEKEPPSLEEILNLIPEEKRIVITC